MTEVEIVEVSPQPTAVVRATVGWDGLRDLYDRGFAAVFATAAAQGVQLVGAPFGFYPVPPGEQVTLEVGAVVSRPIDGDGDVVPGELPGGRVARIMHVGPYDALSQTYEALREWMAEQDVNPGMGMWEVYLDDPSATTDPATLRTEVNWLLAD